MKKLLSIFVLIILVSAGCEEDKMKLSEFIPGQWDSDLTILNPGTEDEMLVYFYAEFRTDNTFDLDFLSYPDKIAIYSFENLGYTINSEFNLTIDNPMETGETVDFDIVWNSGFDKMVWVPEPSIDDNPPTMVFTKR